MKAVAFVFSMLIIWGLCFLAVIATAAPGIFVGAVIATIAISILFGDTDKYLAKIVLDKSVK